MIYSFFPKDTRAHLNPKAAQITLNDSNIEAQEEFFYGESGKTWGWATRRTVTTGKLRNVGAG
jgi:hypothetical protein